MTPQQKNTLEDYLVGRGAVRRRGGAQHGGFHGMLASIGMPIVIDLNRQNVRERAAMLILVCY